mgnify:CR=1 FL=1
MFDSLDEIPLELAPGMTHDGPPPADALPDTRVEPLCKEIIRLRIKHFCLAAICTESLRDFIGCLS